MYAQTVNERLDVTLRQVLDDYAESGRIGDISLNNYSSMVARCLGDWLLLPVTAITEEMVEVKFRRVTEKHGETSANMTFRILRLLLTYASSRYKTNGVRLIPFNPVCILSDLRLWHEDKVRKNIIEPHDLKKFWQAIHDMPHLTTRDCTVRDFMVLLLLTGLRKEEGLQLEWANVDLDNGFLLVDMTDVARKKRATKNGEKHKLPLSDYLWDMLRVRKANAREGERYVFPGRYEGHYTYPYNALTWIRDRSGLDFTFHDIRRSFCTYALEELMIEERWVKRLMNHKFKDVTNRHYATQIPEKLRPFMQRITDFVLEKVS